MNELEKAVTQAQHCRNLTDHCLFFSHGGFLVNLFYLYHLSGSKMLTLTYTFKSQLNMTHIKA